mgnify:CR=1 FL=1
MQQRLTRCLAYCFIATTSRFGRLTPKSTPGALRNPAAPSRVTKPTANTEKVVIFFDAVKVLTDMYDVHFDGADVDFDDNDKKEKAEAKEYAKNLKKYTEGGK